MMQRFWVFTKARTCQVARSARATLRDRDGDPAAPRPRRSVSSSVLRVVVLPMGVSASRWGLRCVSLVISDAERLFLCLPAIRTSCLQTVQVLRAFFSCFLGGVELQFFLCSGYRFRIRYSDSQVVSPIREIVFSLSRWYF